MRGERGPAGPAAAPLRCTGLTFSPDGVALQTRTDGTLNSATPLFRSIKVDAASYSIKLVGVDNSTLTINLLPLFKKFHEETRP